MDKFDKIRQALWQYRDDPKPRAIVTGIMWCPEWSESKDGIIKEKGTPTSGHAFLWIGQKIIDNEPYLVAHLSNGKYIGDRGRFYFKREVVNEMCTFGNFMFLDLTDKEIVFLQEMNTFKGCLKNGIIEYIKSIFS